MNAYNNSNMTSPANSTSYLPLTAHGKSGTPPAGKPKPINVFSNDGSFLERFQRNKKVGLIPKKFLSSVIDDTVQEEEEKKKQEDLLEK